MSERVCHDGIRVYYEIRVCIVEGVFVNPTLLFGTCRAAQGVILVSLDYIVERVFYGSEECFSRNRRTVVFELVLRAIVVCNRFQQCCAWIVFVIGDDADRIADL